MEKKFKIPNMSVEKIAKLYSKIRPIVSKSGTPCYLRELSKKELTDIAYTWLDELKDYDYYVDFNELSVLTDVKMLHRWGNPAFFTPSVGEVIRQIPKEYLDKVVAFEIIGETVGISSIYRDELNAGFHVSVVRLYQAKNSTNEAATPCTTWLSKNSKCPIGMEKKDFRKFLKLIE